MKCWVFPNLFSCFTEPNLNMVVWQDFSQNVCDETLAVPFFKRQGAKAHGQLSHSRRTIADGLPPKLRHIFVLASWRLVFQKCCPQALAAMSTGLKRRGSQIEDELAFLAFVTNTSGSRTT
jgi:hypothetical protein